MFCCFVFIFEGFSIFGWMNLEGFNAVKISFGEIKFPCLNLSYKFEVIKIWSNGGNGGAPWWSYFWRFYLRSDILYSVQAQCIKSCVQLGCLFAQLDRPI